MYLLSIYKIITFVFYPFIILHLIYRLCQKKEHKESLVQKLGFAYCKRPEGKLIWLHASSVGEVLSILPFIEYFSKNNKFSILLTTSTISSAKLIKTKLPENVIHQFLPIDCINVVKRFLKFWQPNLILWTESELWPNVIIESAKNCEIILINGRISDKSFEKWARYKTTTTTLLHCFSLLMAQSKEDKEKIESLGGKNVICFGNIKYCSKAFDADKKILSLFKKNIKNRIVLMAASTHFNEEEIILSHFKKLKQNFPELFLIISPINEK